MEIYRIDQQDRERVDAFIVRRWFGLRMAVHGELFDLGHAEGFYTEEDGEVTDVYGKEQAEKARHVAAGIVEDVKEKFNLDEVVSKASDAVSEVKEKFTFDEVVDATVEDIKDEPTEE